MTDTQRFWFWCVFITLWFVLAGVVGGHQSSGCTTVECEMGAFMQGVLWPVTLPYMLGEYVINL